MRTYRLNAVGWAGPPVEFASNFRDNWQGIRGVPDHHGVILRKRAVHTFGLRNDLVGLGVSATGTVVSVKTMQPNRMFYFSGVSYVVELPADVSPPGPGSNLRLTQ